MKLKDILQLLQGHGLAVCKITRIAPLLSSEVVFWLEKKVGDAA